MDMGEACEAFISNFEEKIEQFLRKRKTNDFQELNNKFCGNN